MEALAILLERVNLNKFEAKRDLIILLGYSTNTCSYKVFELRISTIIKSIKMIIDYSSAIMMVEYGDNNVFKSSGTSKPGTYDRNL